jgi:hypothetical protein
MDTTLRTCFWKGPETLQNKQLKGDTNMARITVEHAVTDANERMYRVHKIEGLPTFNEIPTTLRKENYFHMSEKLNIKEYVVEKGYSEDFITLNYYYEVEEFIKKLEKLEAWTKMYAQEKARLERENQDWVNKSTEFIF